jgi:ankyrin repeat protein
MKVIAYVSIAASSFWGLAASPLFAQRPDVAAPRIKEKLPAPDALKTDAKLEGIRTGYAGHYSCRVFTGREKALAVAASDEEPEVVQKLVAGGANIEAKSRGKYTKGMTMLQVAVWYGWTAEAVELLIKAGANVNATDARGNTALIHATQCKPVDRQVVELLIRAGAGVNQKDRKGMTPLMHAAMCDNSPHTIELLLKAGARHGAADNTGWTALMHATRRKDEHLEIVAALLKGGADANAVHRHGGAALASAALNGQTQVVEMLIKAGARVNAADAAGWTPLLCAAQGGHARIVEQLLQAGADINAVDHLGRTSLVLATTNEHREAAALLTPAKRQRPVGR